jgi:hypothetical protein
VSSQPGNVGTVLPQGLYRLGESLQRLPLVQAFGRDLADARLSPRDSPTQALLVMAQALPGDMSVSSGPP